MIPIRQGIRRLRLDIKTGMGTTAVKANLCTWHANRAQTGGTYADPDGCGIAGPIVLCVSVKHDGLAAIGECDACMDKCAIGAGR